jgi:hypothetical protein
MTPRWFATRLLFGYQEAFDLRAALPVLALHAFTQVPMIQV